MKSNYKKIGAFVRQVSNRNTDLSVTNLKGININKEFMPSVANINGTDLSKYKVVNKGQFAFNPMHVGRDEMLPISLWLEDKPIIVSPAYIVFEIIDQSILDPKYLMIWCSRNEFDRNCWFTTDSSVRGGFSWEDLCEITFPLFSLKEQNKIVSAYKKITGYIDINIRYSSLIDEQISTIYSNLIGSKFENQVQNGNWTEISIQKLIDENILFPNQDGNHGEIHPKSSDYVEKGIPFIMANDINNGIVDIFKCKFIKKAQADSLRIGFSIKDDVLITHKASMGRVAIVPDLDSDYIMLTPQVTYYRIKDKNKLSKEFLYASFLSTNFQNSFCNDGEQSTRSYIGITNQRKLNLILPDVGTIKTLTELISPLLHQKNILAKKNHLLLETSKMLLAQLSVV